MKRLVLVGAFALLLAAWGGGFAADQAKAAHHVAGEHGQCESPRAGPNDSTWALPLSKAADDAESAACAYFTDAVIDEEGNRVEVYLAGAPQSIIDDIEAAHPGTFVIHNDAAHPLRDLLKIANSLPFDSLDADGIEVTSVGPTSDGHLQVEVTPASDLQAARDALASFARSVLGAAGADVMEVSGNGEFGHNLDQRMSPSHGGQGRLGLLLLVVALLGVAVLVEVVLSRLSSDR